MSMLIDCVDDDEDEDDGTSGEVEDKDDKISGEVEEHSEGFIIKSQINWSVK